MDSTNRFKLRKGKVIKDQIHDLIDLEPLDLAIIDTRSFQRLREVRQLGVCYFVYPGATHNRFEHSIGTAHLAGLFMDSLRKEQPELDISDVERNCVRLAGLCHDLGHGPFSHAFDNEFMRRAVPDKKWSHEAQSGLMLDYIINEEWNMGSQDLDSYEVEKIKDLMDIIRNKEFLKDLIVGEPRGGSILYGEKRFLFQVVANKTSSIDVDKFDYLKRDSHNVLGKSVFDHTRFMKFSRVINNEICYKAPADQSNIYELFQARYNLFRTIYTHQGAKAIELMVVDAFLEADHYLEISKKVEDPESFLELTDTLLHYIEFSKNPELQKSRDIIRRLRRRDLYKCVDCVVIPDDNKILSDLCQPGRLSEEDIARYSGGSIRSEDIILDFVKLNFGNGKKNPAELVRFYTKYDSTNSFFLAPQACTALVPTIFEEMQLRVFVRHESKQRAAQKAFRSWAVAQHIPKGNHKESFVFSPEPSNNVRLIGNSLYQHSPIYEFKQTQGTMLSSDNEDDDSEYELKNNVHALLTPPPSKCLHVNFTPAMESNADLEDDGGSHHRKRRRPLSASPLSGERVTPAASSTIERSSHRNYSGVNNSQFPSTRSLDIPQKVDSPSSSPSHNYTCNNILPTPVPSASRYHQRIAATAGFKASGNLSPPQMAGSFGLGSLLSPAHKLPPDDAESHTR